MLKIKTPATYNCKSLLLSLLLGHRAPFQFLCFRLFRSVVWVIYGEWFSSFKPISPTTIKILQVVCVILVFWILHTSPFCFVFSRCFTSYFLNNQTIPDHFLESFSYSQFYTFSFLYFPCNYSTFHFSWELISWPVFVSYLYCIWLGVPFPALSFVFLHFSSFISLLFSFCQVKAIFWMDFVDILRESVKKIKCYVWCFCTQGHSTVLFLTLWFHFF